MGSLRSEDRKLIRGLLKAHIEVLTKDLSRPDLAPHGRAQYQDEIRRAKVALANMDGDEEPCLGDGETSTREFLSHLESNRFARRHGILTAADFAVIDAARERS